MVMSRFILEWKGWVGQPGFTTFNVSANLDDTQTNAAAAAIKTFITQWAATLPSVITLFFHPTVQVVNDGDGTLVEERTISTKPTDTAGAGTGNFSAVTGIAVTWRTGQRGPKKPILGRTYIVPCSQSAYDADGSLGNSVQAGILASANTYVNRVAPGTPGHPVVWHHNTPGAADGQSYPVVGVSVADRVAYLSSRRV